MASFPRVKVLVLVVLVAAAARFAQAHGALPVRTHYVNADVTTRYDNAACGPVRAVSASLTGPSGKAMILCLLNYERRDHDLIQLRETPLLDRSSERHSADMVARRFFEHNTPDGATPQDRIAAAGYVAAPLGMTGENLGWGEGPLASPASIVDHWMHSPGHRENILRPEFREVGIGIVLGGAPSPKPAHMKAGTYTTDFGG